MLVGEIHHLNQQIRVFDLFQRGAERFHQPVGQLMDESHRVRQKERHVLHGVRFRINAAHAGVQGGKEHILLHHLLFLIVAVEVHHAVQNRGLSRVGIAHQRHFRDFGLGALLAHGLPGSGHVLQLLFQFADPMLNLTSVQFQLGLSRASVA